MKIHLNDAPHELCGADTLEQLLKQLGQADRRGIAVAVNDSVVSRAAWSSRTLAEGDRVLVIQATQGG